MAIKATSTDKKVFKIKECEIVKNKLYDIEDGVQTEVNIIDILTNVFGTEEPFTILATAKKETDIPTSSNYNNQNENENDDYEDEEYYDDEESE